MYSPFIILLFIIILKITKSYFDLRMHKQLVFSGRYVNLRKSNRLKSLHGLSLFSTSSDIDITKDNDNVRVITYNVLSSNLAEPDYFFT